ncbi:hypothetical protein OSB04_un000585 [Centaurea solstitialis]|uniref:Reverse transcriptase domain-containing protein n=1 Tax=Centaurea solstitialis TaxID=347529 RepID=A0AA38SHQ8_9ASTR|nr:hypothetical protein OSB04_un000585 [Centaurea solstitialis]
MWNIRGLNSPIKQRQVKDLLKEYDISCCAIIETHVHANSLSEICSKTFGNWHWCSNHLVCDHGTRIILAWDMRRVDVVTMEIHAQFIHCQIRLHGNLEPFFVSCIYGENRTVSRRGLWSGLRKFKVLLRDSPWLIMGDFNTMLFPHDGLGGSSRRSSDMSEFAECLMDIDVYDVHYTGVQYTWCQKPSEDGGIKRKLDRVMANNEFTTRFSDVTVQFLPRGLSDHSAAITSFMGGLRQFVVPFKFDNFLTNDHRFYDIVASGWKVHVDGTFMHRVLCKLKALKTPIRKLRSSFHNLTKMTASLKHELEVAQLASDLDPTNGSLQEDVCVLRHAFLKACYNEEQAIKQRAKIRWLLEGDSNTKFFHQVVKEKRHVHHIHSVMDASGRYVYSQEVPDAFVEHLKLYLGVRDDSLDPTMQPELFTSKLSLAQALDMIRPITDDDIKQAMFSIGSDKAPGSDGYSSKFFKKAWHIVGPEVSVAIHNFFYRGHLAKELNHTLVCLLPKNPNATRVSDFRPISCCSTLYKCISKVIVTRMKSALDTVVGKYQSAFIPGRKIVDNILLAHELVIGYQKDAGQPRCAFKIDIRKAYDMVDWRFLITMLENLGFHPVLINWIKEMVSTTTYSVAINGESRGYFHGKRGIRQGDPLSPYLFTLIMEGFSLIFRQCINEAEYFGYHKGCAQFHLTHLCFADDLFVFTRGDVQSVEVLKKALSIFEAKSGLSANLDKSEVFFGNVPLDTRNAIRTCLPFRNGIFPIRYLGVPLSPVRLKRSDYGTLILKVKNRIQNWKAKFLSFGGRMQLINSVLHSLQLYWMGVFNFPAAVIHEIEGLFRSFLWHQDVMGRGNCRVAWDMVCKPKANGGLGFKRLGWWNKALLAQHLWDLATKRESLWVRWVLCDAFKGANMWIARKSTRWSWVLTKIMEIRPLFRMHIRTTVGNGVNTNAWNDTWLSCGPLSLLLSSRFVHENGFTMETTVADLGEAFQGHWPVTWINRFDQLSNIAFPALEDTRDVISWLDDANPVEDFKVSMAYKAIQGEQMEVPWHRMVWFKGCIPKHAFCLWLACWRRLPTQDRMMAWKEEPPDYSCSLCKSCVDSHSHLFFMCSFANEVWKEVTLAIGWQNASMTWDDMLLLMSDQATAPKRLIRKLAISATVYEVWIERNKRLFTEERRTSVQVTKLILFTIKLREEWKTARKITTSNDLRTNHIQERGNDGSPSNDPNDEDPLRWNIGPITRSKSKMFKDAVNVLCELSNLSSFLACGVQILINQRGGLIVAYLIPSVVILWEFSVACGPRFLVSHNLRRFYPVLLNSGEFSRVVMAVSDGFDSTVVVEEFESEKENVDGAEGLVGGDKAIRSSVFDRLTPSVKKKSFAAMVGTTQSTKLEFFPLDDKKGKSIAIPKALAVEAAKAFKSTIVGYFLGLRVSFPIVQRSLKTKWSAFGFSEVMMNANGFFFIKFNDEGGSMRAVEEGMVMIQGVPMFVTPWDPSKGLVRPSHDTCPLWVKFHNVPLVLFNHEGISRIASAIGVPKQMDECTATMCDKRWGRPGFAKVLIDVWAVGTLKRELEVIIPHLHDDGNDKVKIDVEYLWEPAQCTHCCVFGHKVSSCVKAVVKKNVENKKNKEVDADGFTMVNRKQWRKKEVPSIATTVKDGASSSGTKDVPQDVLQETVCLMETPVEVPMEQKTAGSMETRMDGPSVEVLTKQGLEQPPVMETEVAGEENQPSKGDVSSPKDVTTVMDDTQVEDPVRSRMEESKKNSPGTVPPNVSKPPLKGEAKRTMINMACWNIRGLNASDKQSEVISFIKGHFISIVCLVETHLSATSLGSVVSRVFSRWSWVSNQAVSTYGTRILLAWDVSLMDVSVVEMHEQFLNCSVHIRGCNRPIQCTFAYGANTATQRRLLWSGMRKFKVCMGDQPWIVMGDFNAMLFPHDALGGISKRNGDMIDFFECLQDVELFDVVYSGIQYTWCQKPKEESGIRRKLDRVLANVTFTSIFQDARVRFMPRGISDHCPSILSFKGGIGKRKFGFRFDNFLVEHPRFLQIVKDAWNVQINGSFMFRLTAKLKALKTPLRKLRSSYGNLSSNVHKLKIELDVVQLACDMDPFNDELKEDLMALRGAYQQALRDEEVAARQRAKVRWLREGDSNTRFFHNVVREKRHAHRIQSVRDSGGTFVYDDDVGVAFIEHLTSFMGKRDRSLDPVMPMSSFQRRLSFAESSDMIRPITDLEIRKAMFGIGNDKAPGSDGFSSKFFKASWDIVGGEVSVAIHNFFYSGILLKELNHTLICLLPKIPNATSVSDYRPIACCSVLYKCISKIIVDRMKPVLDSIVHRSQSAFIPGRRIVDNILMAHELVVGYHLNSGPPRCAFKIDLRKAYDMVDWRFLIQMLVGFGFHPVLIRWIEEMISSTSYSVMINGEQKGFFKGERGIRQGDPLSPYLFTLIMEGFTMIFKQCILEAENFGYHPGCADIDLTHLCFADDLFVFTYGDVGSVEILKKALTLFGHRSGLSPNLLKSDVFFGNVPVDTQAAILNCLSYRLGSFPIRYLGVPLSPVSLKVADYGCLVAKVKARLSNWKHKHLSFGGRKQLVISVLQALQLYWMAVFVFPSAIVHEIEGLLRAFLWTQGDPVAGRCRVAWETVCRPKEAGGLGFKRLSLWNRALIARNLWDIAMIRDTMWVRWVTTRYLRSSTLWTVRPAHGWSWTLRKMWSLRDMIRPFIRKVIGNGSTTNAWEDTWLSCGPLASLISYRRIHARDYSVSTTVQQFLNSVSAWPPDWVQHVPQLEAVPLPTLNDQSDSIVWVTRDGRQGSFTVASTYASFDDVHQLVPWWKAVWYPGHIPKFSFCLWIACHKRHPTHDRMLTWKHEPPDWKCSLCGLCMDSHNHLFFECQFSESVWNQIRLQVEWRMAPSRWDDMLELISASTAVLSLKHKLALAATVYFIWRERNRRIFTDERRNAQHLIKEIMEVVLMRMAWKNLNKDLLCTDVDA